MDADRLAWAIGSSSPRKRVHRSGCRYARRPYVWAGDRDEDELLAALIAAGAHDWHEGCRFCSRDLDDNLRLARADGR